MFDPNEQGFGRIDLVLNVFYSPPLFALGRVVATQAALDLLDRLAINASSLLGRHCQGDWGDIEPEDAAANANALKQSARLLSAYQVAAGGERIFVITELTECVTTLLLPHEY